MSATLWLIVGCTVINAINIALMVTAFVSEKRWRAALEAEVPA